MEHNGGLQIKYRFNNSAYRIVSFSKPRLVFTLIALCSVSGSLIGFTGFAVTSLSNHWNQSQQIEITQAASESITDSQLAQVIEPSHVLNSKSLIPKVEQISASVSTADQNAATPTQTEEPRIQLNIHKDSESAAPINQTPLVIEDFTAVRKTEGMLVTVNLRNHTAKRISGKLKVSVNGQDSKTSEEMTSFGLKNFVSKQILFSENSERIFNGKLVFTVTALSETGTELKKMIREITLEEKLESLSSNRINDE